jgi:hypothetical protein
MFAIDYWKNVKGYEFEREGVERLTELRNSSMVSPILFGATYPTARKPNPRNRSECRLARKLTVLAPLDIQQSMLGESRRVESDSYERTNHVQ